MPNFNPENVTKNNETKAKAVKALKKKRQKGPGFLGTLKRPDGKSSTELSIGVNFDGKEREIPTLVPTLDKNEISSLLKGGKPSRAIVGKAVEHARGRMKKGKSPFKSGVFKEK